MLKLEPGREEEAARYWLANLAVNAAVMRAIDSDDLEPRREMVPERCGRAGRERPLRRMRHR